MHFDFFHKCPQCGWRREAESSKSFQVPQANRTPQRTMRSTDFPNIRIGAVNIVGRRASEKDCRRLCRGSEKRRKAEPSCAIFAHKSSQLVDVIYVSALSIIGAMARRLCILFIWLSFFDRTRLNAHLKRQGNLACGMIQAWPICDHASESEGRSMELRFLRTSSAHQAN